MTSWIVPDALDGQRADRAVALLLDVPVNAARRLLTAGRVRVAGKRVKKGDAVRAGDVVELSGTGAWLVPSDAPLPVLYADARVVVVDKPAGMPSHPLVPGEGDTAVDALVARFPEVAGASLDAREAGLVHRLDTGTSGCLAVARDRETWTALRRAFAAGDVEKRYLAVVEGVVRAPLTLDRPLAHHPSDPRRMITSDRGQAAVTTVEPLTTSATHSLVAVRADGGRRHQVRVHLASAGHVLVGDVLYGAAVVDDAPWHLLHARALRLPHTPLVVAAVPFAFRTVAAARGLGFPDGGI